MCFLGSTGWNASKCCKLETLFWKNFKKDYEFCFQRNHALNEVYVVAVGLISHLVLPYSFCACKVYCSVLEKCFAFAVNVHDAMIGDTIMPFNTPRLPFIILIIVLYQVIRSSKDLCDDIPFSERVITMNSRNSKTDLYQKLVISSNLNSY